MLLVDLLKSDGGLRIIHPGPHLRDWREPERPSPQEAWVAHRDIADVAMTGVGSDPEYFLALIPVIGALPADHRADLIARLTVLTPSVTDDVMRRRLSDALREVVTLHTKVGDAPWAMPPDDIDRLRQATEALAPGQPADQSFWLFNERWPQLGSIPTEASGHAGRIAALYRLRTEAVSRILDSGGFDALVTLAETTGNGDLIGAALAGQPQPAYDDVLLPWLAGSRPSVRLELAHAYFAARMFTGGLDFLGRATEPMVRARLLLAAPDPSDAWQKLPGLGAEVAEIYWREFHPGLGRGAAGVEQAVAGLNSVGRFAAALDLIAMHAEQVDQPEIAAQAAAACEGLVAANESDPEMSLISRYDVQRVVDLLDRHRLTLGADRVVAVEFSLVPLLGYDLRTPSIHARLAESPDYFADLVASVYRPEGSDERTDDQRRINRATVAYRVLRAWRRCPGTGSDGAIESEALGSWVERARELLAASGRLRVGEHTIGGVLAFAQPDEDGSYPPVAVRDLLEDVQSEALDQGLSMGIYNKRGVTWRGATDGGAQEYTLVERYRDLATTAEGWPRSQRILREIADTYEREARQQDDEAEGRRRGIWH